MRKNQTLQSKKSLLLIFFSEQVTRHCVTGFEEQYIALKEMSLKSVYICRRRPNLLRVDWVVTSSSGSLVFVKLDD